MWKSRGEIKLGRRESSCQEESQQESDGVSARESCWYLYRGESRSNRLPIFGASVFTIFPFLGSGRLRVDFITYERKPWWKKKLQVKSCEIGEKEISFSQIAPRWDCSIDMRNSRIESMYLNLRHIILIKMHENVIMPYQQMCILQILLSQQIILMNRMELHSRIWDTNAHLHLNWFHNNNSWPCVRLSVQIKETLKIQNDVWVTIQILCVVLQLLVHTKH